MFLCITGSSTISVCPWPCVITGMYELLTIKFTARKQTHWRRRGGRPVRSGDHELFI